MKKQFKMLKDELVVTVDDEQDLSIPGEKGTEKIGTFTQHTVQHIPKNKVKHLSIFLNKEKDNAEEQLARLGKEYDLVKDLGDIDEAVQAGCVKAIDKGNKKFKEEMRGLAHHIGDLQRKKQFKQQIDYINVQLALVKSDVDKLNKAIK